MGKGKRAEPYWPGPGDSVARVGAALLLAGVREIVERERHVERLAAELEDCQAFLRAAQRDAAEARHGTRWALVLSTKAVGRVLGVFGSGELAREYAEARHRAERLGGGAGYRRGAEGSERAEWIQTPLVVTLLWDQRAGACWTAELVARDEDETADVYWVEPVAQDPSPPIFVSGADAAAADPSGRWRDGYLPTRAE